MNTPKAFQQFKAWPHLEPMQKLGVVVAGVVLANDDTDEDRQPDGEQNCAPVHAQPEALDLGVRRTDTQVLLALSDDRQDTAWIEGRFATVQGTCW